MAVESFNRADAGNWLFTPLEESIDQLFFPKLELSISLKDIYSGISFKPNYS